MNGVYLQICALVIVTQEMTLIQVMTLTGCNRHRVDSISPNPNLEQPKDRRMKNERKTDVKRYFQSSRKLTIDFQRYQYVVEISGVTALSSHISAGHGYPS